MSFREHIDMRQGGLYNAELIFLDGPWDGLEDVEQATAAWVHWFNTERLHSMLGYKTPLEAEQAFYAEQSLLEAA